MENYGALDVWENDLLRQAEISVYLNEDLLASKTTVSEREQVGSWLRHDEDKLACLQRDMQRRRKHVEPSDVVDGNLRDQLEMDYQDLVRLVAAVRDALDRGDPTSIMRGIYAVMDYQTELLPDNCGLDPDIWGEALGAEA